MTHARLLSCLLVAGTIAAFPAAAEAETITLGPPTLTDTSSGTGCGMMCTNTVLAQLTPSPGTLAVAPRSGRITTWRVRSFESVNGPGAVRLRVLRPIPDSTALKSVGRSEPAGSEDGQTANPTNLPIAAGDLIGVEVLSLSDSGYFVLIDNAAGGTQARYTNFADGATAGPAGSPSPGALQLNATVELDDLPPPPAKDITKPTISSLILSPSAFQAANSGPTLAAAAVGTQVVYELSETATLKLTVERATKGQKRKGKCRKPKRGAAGKKCTRYVAVKGSASHAGTAGLNRFRFMGRLRGKQLKPGRYRLVIVATDGAGLRSKAKRKAFRILR